MPAPIRNASWSRPPELHSGAERSMTVRAVVAVLAALLIAVQVVRNAAVNALAGTRPAEAARIWKGHPASAISVAMTEIIPASRARRPIPERAFVQMANAAAKAPLASEPFLVRGVQASLQGNVATAQRAFEEAQWRDPRSLLAAFFLADRYVQSGDKERGLREVATLARLSPEGTTVAAAYLARYAKVPANWPSLRQFLRANPQLAQPALVALASDNTTVAAALALFDPGEVGNPQWLVPLVDTLIKTGDYARARSVWAQGGRVDTQPVELLHDADFRDFRAPPPFNWQLTNSTVGLAERRPPGRLHILFYGDENGTLARQLLVLSPGKYRMSMRLLGDSARAHVLTWSLWCDKAVVPMSSVALDTAAARGWQFEVRAGCTAQWLKLSGTSSDIPQRVDVSIAGLTLSKVLPHG